VRRSRHGGQVDSPMFEREYATVRKVTAAQDQQAPRATQLGAYGTV